MSEDTVARTVFKVERLEYGKFCVTPAGPIAPGAGYGHLAASSGFPPDLVPVCTPFSIGLPETVLSSLDVSHSSHVSVVIPCRRAGEIQSIFCMTRVRPEDGESGKGRGFTLARFCTAINGINPALLYRAATSEPFLPLTRPVIPRESPAINIPAVHGWNVADNPDENRTVIAGPPVAPLLPAFLGYLFSGIPVLIKSAASEAWFYRLVAEVWRVVPQLLRPLLSAAWGIPPDIAHQFAISASFTEADFAAVYDCEKNQWRTPRVVRTKAGDRVVQERFTPDALKPGQLAGNISSLQKTNPTLSFYVNDLLRALPSLPHFDDPLMWQLFRIPPRIIRDSRRVGALAGWIENPDPAKRIEPDTLNLDFPVYASKALPHLLRAMAIPEKRRQAEEALRILLLGPHSESVVKALDGTDRRDEIHYRAQLLKTLALRNANGVLFDYKLAVEVDQAADIPHVYEKDIAAALDAALANGRPEELQQIKALFNFQLSPEFSRWLNTNDNAFLLAARLLPQTKNEVLLSNVFMAHASTPGVEVLDRFIRRQNPDPKDVETIRQLPELHQNAFSLVIESAWNSNHAQTESMLSWALKFHRKPDILLDLAGENWANFAESSLGALLREISIKRVPRSLYPRTAAVLFRHWGALRDLRQRVDRDLNEFLVLLPFSVQKILNLSLGSAQYSTPSELRLAANDPAGRIEVGYSPHAPDRILISPSSKTIEAVLTEWEAMARHLTPDLAQIIEAWLKHAADIPPDSRLATLRALLSGVFPAVEPSAPVASGSMALLPRMRCDKLPELLWEACQQSWHVKLVLLVFPQVSFFLEPRHELLLVHNRKWLAEYLRRKDLADTAISQFGTCCREFLSTPYPKGDHRGPWHQEFRSRPCVWAAFKDLPPALRGKLSTALNGYAASDGEREELCLRYLKQDFNDPQLLRDVLAAFGFKTDLATLERFAEALFKEKAVRIDGNITSVKDGLRTFKMERREASFLEKLVAATTSDTWSKAIQLLPVKEERRGKK